MQVLKDPGLRATYDAQLLQQELKASVVVQDEIGLDDMDFDAPSNTYSYTCRCGDSYQVTQEEMVPQLLSIIVPCHGCSNFIAVHPPTSERKG